MDVGTQVRRIKGGQVGIIVAKKGSKIRVQSISDPACIWRLQAFHLNYTIVEALNIPNIIQEEACIGPDTSKICTRAQYRKKLLSIGVNLEKDRDVLHIISTANGGADHIDNYLFLGNMRLNRKLGKNADEIYCYLCGLEGTKRAVAASIKFGKFEQHYVPPDVLYERGLARFSSLF